MQNNCPKCSQPALNGAHTDPWACITAQAARIAQLEAIVTDNQYLRRILDEYKALADKRLEQLAAMEDRLSKHNKRNKQQWDGNK